MAESRLSKIGAELRAIPTALNLIPSWTRMEAGTRLIREVIDLGAFARNRFRTFRILLERMRAQSPEWPHYSEWGEVVDTLAPQLRDNDHPVAHHDTEAAFTAVAEIIDAEAKRLAEHW